MTATVDIVRITGASTQTVITSPAGPTYMKQADNGDADANNPVPAPASGFAYSYFVSTRLKTGATGASSGIGSITWYSDGSAVGTDLTVMGQTATSYVQATSAVVLNTTNYSSLTAAAVDVSTFTSGSPKTVGGSDPGTAINTLFGNLMVYQLRVGPTAAPGLTAAKTYTWSYQET